MSTRCPAQVKRTAVTAGEGTVSRLRPRPVLTAVAALVLAWIGASLYLFVWYPSDPPGRADAVVVLSGGRDSRLDPAIRLVERHVAPLLVISGAGYDPKWRTARRLCAHGARGYRVLCFDPKPYSTRGEAEEVARIAARRRWRSIVVVTSRYHVTRARMLFRRCFHGDVDAVGASYPLAHVVSFVLSEWAKLAWALTVARSC
jgi:uncharacterized SAM-binding protein YcdF (DUF218 family)